MILILTISGWQTRVWAQPELVVVGAHVDDERDAEASEGILKASLSKVDGFVYVGSKQAQQRLRGIGPRLVSQALQVRGMSLLSEGRVLFEHADLQAARDRVAEAIVAFEDNLGVSLDNRGLIDALLVQGNIALAMGDPSAASHAFKRVVRIDPNRVLDTVNHPPKVTQLFADVRKQVLAVPSGSLQFEGLPREATVHIDGRLHGSGDQLVENMVPGQHHVLVSSPTGTREHSIIQVRPGEKSSVKPDLKHFFIGPSAETEPARELQIRAVYSQLGDRLTDGFVLIAGETGVDEVGLQLYESRTGNFSSVLRQSSDGDAWARLADMVPQLATLQSTDGSLSPTSVSQEGLGLNLGTNATLARVLFDASSSASSVIAAAGVQGVAEPVPPAVKNTERQPLPWYFWVGAGAVVAGATTTVLLLKSGPKGADSEPISTGTGTAVVRF